MVSENVTINVLDDEVVSVASITEEPVTVEVMESEPATVIDNLTEIPVYTIIQGIPIEQKGVPNGVATLDENGKVPLEQIPDLNIDPEGIKNEVKQWIDDAVIDKVDSDQLNQIIQAAIQDKVDLTEVNRLIQIANENDIDLEQLNQIIQSAIQNKAEINDVKQWIDDSVANKPDSSEVQQWIGDATSGKADSAVVNEQLDSKLDKSEFHQHFRGVYASYAALNNITNPIAGDYAHVDAGVGKPTIIYVYDLDDTDWVKQGSSGTTVASTDDVVEGNTNLYFTNERVSAIVNTMIAPINNKLINIDSLLDDILGD